MNRVLKCRTAAGLTQDELATRSGVAQPNIAAYESGRRRPSDAMLARLARAAAPLPHEVLATKRSDVIEITTEHRMSNVRLFGSVLRGIDTPESDIDLLVTAPPKTGLMAISAFALDVETLLGVKVDIVTDGGLRAEHPIRRRGGRVVIAAEVAIARKYGQKTLNALNEMVRLTGAGARLVERGHDWYVGDPDNVPGLASEGLVIKLGENASRVSKVFEEDHPEVPWRVIQDMRNRLAHYYESTDYEVVWSTLGIDFPEINAMIRRLLGRGFP